MKEYSFWNKSIFKRQLIKLVVSVFTLSSLLMSLPPDSKTYSGISKAFSANINVADQPNLGVEDYWSYYNYDLGADWDTKVNTATGNLVIEKDLFTISGKSIPLSEGLTYNGLSQQDVGIGKGWTLNNGSVIQENADGSVTYKDEDATNHIFTKNSDGSYCAPSGVHLTLTKIQSDIFTIKDKDQTTYRYENGHLVSVTDEKGKVTALNYGTNGNLSKVTDPSGRSLVYAYDTNGRLGSITDPTNHKFQFSYNTNGRLIDITDPRNIQTKFEYDSSNQLIYFIDGNGHKTSFNYDNKRRMVKIIDPRSTSTDVYATSLTYDDPTLTTTITDPSGKNETYTHNSSGNLIQFKNGAGNILKYEWNNNEQIKSTDSQGSTSFQYDDNGNVTQESDAISSSNTATTNIQYDSKNNPIELTDPNQNKSIARYDGNSNEISSVNLQRLEADGKTYDSNGNVTSSTNLGAPTYNLLENGSFERQDASTGDFIGWHKGGSTSAITADTTVSTFGTNSLKISSTTSTTAYLYSSALPISVGDKLTFSTSGRIQNVSGTTGAFIALEFFDSNLNYISTTCSNGYTNSGNENFVVIATAPTNSAYVVAILDMDQASGTVWFDGAQLEKPLKSDEGNILTDYDSVENSSFERGGYLWGAGGTAGATTITTETAWAGSRSAKINLTSTGDAWIISNEISVKAGESLTLSGFLKTNNLSGKGAQVAIDYYDSTGAYLDYAATSIQTGTQDFTRFAVSTTPPANAVKARVMGVVGASTGTAYFDNIKLTPRTTTLYSYDSNGNYLTSELDANGNLTQYTYDDEGNRTSITDAKGYKTNYSYDENNNLKSVTDPQNRTTFYQYDPVNKQVTIQDARSSSSEDNTYKTTYGYNELNKITSITDPLMRKTTYTYDKSGNIGDTTYPNGNKVVNTHDGDNRLSQKSYSGSTQLWNYSYDMAGNLTNVTDEQNRSYVFTYDGANRLTKTTNFYGYSMNYQLDNAGNVISTTDSNNKTIAYSYGSDNRLLSVTDPSGKSTQYHYDGAGRPFEIIRGNGIKNVQIFDKLGRITEIADPRNPGNASIIYSYDKNNNITAINWLNLHQSFAYDELNRLTSWTDESGNVTNYQYDAVGNLTKKGNQTFTYDAANEITNTGFSYDQNGNMTSDSQFNYTYNNENQLTKVTKISDGSTVATYSYDYRGLRISKTTGSSTIYYHWDDQKRLTRESDNNNNTLALYIYAGNQLVAVEKNGAMYYVHTNQRGDVLALSDSNGNQAATYKYGPWGEFLGKTGTVDIPFRYAGYYYDNETDLYYLKARYYNPKLGRFLTKDQIDYSDIKDPQSLNLFAYTKNNPVMNVDPDGHTVLPLPLFFLPGWGWFTLGAIAVITGAVWVGSHIHLSKQIAYFNIPNSLLRGNGTVDLGKFKDKVRGKTAYRDPKTGWTIEKDTAGHAGKKWKLKDKSGKRIASTDGSGKIISK